MFRGESAVPMRREAGGTAEHSIKEGLAELEGLAGAVRAVARAGSARTASRLALLMQLDQDARASLNRVLLPFRQGVEHKQWRRVAGLACDISESLFQAYAEHVIESKVVDCLPSEELAVGLIRLAADRLLWEHAACRAPLPGRWEHAGGVFAAAIARGGAVRGRVAEEYLRAVAIHSAAVDQLPPELVPAVDALIRFTLTTVELQPVGIPAALFFVDPSAGRAPRRLAHVPDQAESLWFFSSGQAGELLATLAHRIEMAPASVSGALAAFRGEVVAAAIAHLRRHWSGSPPIRRYRRHLVQGRLEAVRGFEQFWLTVSSGGGGHIASWVLRDISRGGVGAHALFAAAANVKVGDLVGVRAEEGLSWHMGVVRRIRGVDADTAMIGIETLSQRPLPIRVDDGRVPTQVLACDPIQRGEAVRLVAPLRTLRPGVPLFVTANGTVQKLAPLDAAMSGCEFELRAYQVL